MRQLSILIGMSFLLGGCATHVSHPANKYKFEQNDTPASHPTKKYKHKQNTSSTNTESTPREGLLYFMPKRTMKVVATQTPFTKKKIEQLKAASDKAGNELKEAKESQEKAKKAAAELKGWIAIIKQYDDGDLSIRESEKLDIGILLTKRAEIKQAELNEINTTNKHKEKKAASVKAEKALKEAQEAFDAKSPKYALSLTLNDMEPDVDYAYRLNFQHNILRDDDFKITVNTRGLLSSGTGTSVGRADDIIAEVGGIILALQNPSTPLLSNIQESNPMETAIVKRRDDNSSAKAVNEFNKATCAFPINQSYKLELNFDPLDADRVKEVNKQLRDCFPYQLHIRHSSNAKLNRKNQTENNNDKSEYTSLSDSSSAPIEDVFHGIAYRPEYPYQVIVEECRGKIVPVGGGLRALSSCVTQDDNMGSDEDASISVNAGEDASININAGEDASISINAGENASIIVNAGEDADIAAFNLQLVAYKQQSIALIKQLHKLYTNFGKACEKLKSEEKEPCEESRLSVQNDFAEPLKEALDKIDSVSLAEFITLLEKASSPNTNNDKIAPFQQEVQNILNDIVVNWLPSTLNTQTIFSQAQLVMLPNKSEMTFIPMQAAIFGNSSQNLTFKDGIVTEWSYAQSSEVLEIVRLPLEIITKALEALPLQIKYDNTKVEGVEAKQRLLLSQQTFALLKSCLEKASNSEDADENEEKTKQCLEDYAIAAEATEDEPVADDSSP